MTTCGIIAVVQVYKQRLKHLLYEHQQNTAALKVDTEEQLQKAADEASKRIRDLMVDIQNMQRDYNEQVSTAALSKDALTRVDAGSLADSDCEKMLRILIK